jgi:hypothetical protein
MPAQRRRARRLIGGGVWLLRPPTLRRHLREARLLLRREDRLRRSWQRDERAHDNR